MPSVLDSLIKPGMGMKLIPEISAFDWDYWNGRLLIWEAPRRNAHYALGVDPAEGVGADRSVCEVIKLGTLEYPDEQVAEFACDFMDPVDFASVVNTIGQFYTEDDGTEAFCTVECNAPCGDTMVNDLRSRWSYGNLFIKKEYDKRENLFTNKIGWWTNKTTRPKIIARGLHAFSYGDLIINSPFLLDEMGDFERDHFVAKAKASYGHHDDRIMALLIGYWGGHDDEWLSGEDIGEQRRLLSLAKYTQQEIIEQQPIPGPKRPDFQNQAISFKEMWANAEEELFG